MLWVAIIGVIYRGIGVVVGARAKGPRNHVFFNDGPRRRIEVGRQIGMVDLSRGAGPIPISNK